MPPVDALNVCVPSQSTAEEVLLLLSANKRGVEWIRIARSLHLFVVNYLKNCCLDLVYRFTPQ